MRALASTAAAGFCDTHGCKALKLAVIRQDRQHKPEVCIMLLAILGPVNLFSILTPPLGIIMMTHSKTSNVLKELGTHNRVCTPAALAVCGGLG